MPNEGFLQRWSRLKADPAAPQLPEVVPAPLPVTAPPPAAAAEIEVPLPTLADAAALGADSDYSAFVARGVDSAVRRLAMKKLFSDPHFNLIDGLDIYMSDYNLPDPVSPAMLASLTHARSVFGRIEEALGLDAPEAPPAEPPALPPPDQEVA
ncbi:MAG: hypothetical protein JWQ01_3325 [Massilia sp.]|jgi:hypothetical protein|nr:hypothetical protein [Massilia sp.]